MAPVFFLTQSVRLQMVVDKFDKKLMDTFSNSTSLPSERISHIQFKFHSATAEKNPLILSVYQSDRKLSSKFRKLSFTH